MNECVNASEDQCAFDKEQVKWLIECEKQTGRERTLFFHWSVCGSTYFGMFKSPQNGLFIH